MLILDLNDDNQKLTEEEQQIKDVIKQTIDTYLEKTSIRPNPHKPKGDIIC